MIKINPTIPVPMPLAYFHTVREVEAIDTAVIQSSECSICLAGCSKDIPVFADLLDPSDSYKNDFSSFIIEVAEGSVVLGELIDIDVNGNETPIAIVNDDYGTFFPLNQMRDRVWGFILDWNKVGTLLGFGYFKFRLKTTSSGGKTISDDTTPCYKLKPYSCQAAHRTVRIETEQSGYIINGFDYRRLNMPAALTRTSPWPQQFRWYGKFKAVIPTIITDNIVTANRDAEQVQTQIVKNYELSLLHIQNNLSEHFIDDNLLANKILMSDYNRNNQKLYHDVRVNPLEIAERSTFNLNENENWVFNFEEYSKRTLKRN